MLAASPDGRKPTGKLSDAMVFTGICPQLRSEHCAAAPTEPGSGQQTMCSQSQHAQCKQFNA